MAYTNNKIKSQDITNNSKQTKKRNFQGRSTFVLMNEQEANQIKTESESRRKSIPQLLREAYFNQKPSKVLFSESDKELILRQMNRIGNNINQIARATNCGQAANWSDEFAKIREIYQSIYEYIGANGVIHQN